MTSKLVIADDPGPQRHELVTIAYQPAEFGPPVFLIVTEGPAWRAGGVMEVEPEIGPEQPDHPGVFGSIGLRVSNIRKGAF